MILKENEKCYNCKHRSQVPGSAHSRCNHPSMKEVYGDPMLNLLSIFASVGRLPPIFINSDALNIKAKKTGVDRGWFNFPLDFDPVWLENCNGFSDDRETDAIVGAKKDTKDL